MHDKVPPISAQQNFWNTWNVIREKGLSPVPQRQALVVTDWLRRMRRTDLDIIDVCCGAGWMCERLLEFGSVMGIDLADEVLQRARQRVPQARFLAGDFNALDLQSESFDVAVSLEVLSHVADQKAFLANIARLLRPGGYLMLATQNRYVLERCNIDPPGPGQIRRWVDKRELQGLLRDCYEVEALFAVTPAGDHGILRLVTSQKLNAVLSRVFSKARLEAAQEKLGIGWTLMALACKR